MITSKAYAVARIPLRYRITHMLCVTGTLSRRYIRRQVSASRMGRNLQLASTIAYLAFFSSGVAGNDNYREDTSKTSPGVDQVNGNVESSIGDDRARRQDWEDTKAEEMRTIQTEATTNEDPDAARRVKRKLDRERAEQEVRAGETGQTSTSQQETSSQDGSTDTDKAKRESTFEVYGSVRLHVIDHYDPNADSSNVDIGDGASRAGVDGTWQFGDDWGLFGRLETGFDIIDTFTSKGQFDHNNKIYERLAYVGLESDFLYVKLGKSYSAYYAVAGDTDRFSIFGGNSSGVYNAGTDGGNTGTGRADDSLQTKLYLDPKGLLTIKPFNLNLQYQSSQPIPHVSGQDYDYSWSASAWLENKRDFGLGLAYHRSEINNPESAAVKEAGIDGDATAAALALRTYGDRWLVSLVLSKQENIETTNEQRYINGNGSELFMQWEFVDNFWLIGGGNWLYPDDGDPDAGDYVVKYGVLGMRYTLDSFRRMLYFEWRDDHGRLVNGQKRDSEFTIGFRWDIGY